MKIIGLNGFKESGKDTTYACIRDLIHSLHEANDLNDAGRVERRAFADSLKIMAALSLGYEGNDSKLIATMNTLKETGRVVSWLNTEPAASDPVGIDGRKYLQNYGNHARTVFGDSFWVDQVVPRDDNALVDVWATLGRKGPWVGLPFLGVITDVRYPNEAERVRKVGGEVWEVIRPGLVSDGHASEQPLPRELVDHVIYNDGSVENLKEAVWHSLRNRKLVTV